MSYLPSPRGFTLIETLFATGILVTALAGVAQLFILGTHLTRQANASGASLIAAQDKLEALGGLAFGYDANGGATTDRSLEASPASSLDEDTDAFVDWLNTSGEASGSPVDAVFARRWRVSSIGADPDSIAIEVCVFRMPANTTVRGADSCLSTIRTRQP